MKNPTKASKLSVLIVKLLSAEKRVEGGAKEKKRPNRVVRYERCSAALGAGRIVTGFIKGCFT